MQLSDYPRPANDNGRGLHWSASPYHPTEMDEWVARLKAMNIRWLKVIDDGGGSSLRLCTRLLAEGIMPVVRLYRLEPNPGHIGGGDEHTIRQLVKAGIRYIETNNEPDLQVEWSIPRPMAWLNIVAENWLYDASKCLDAGALPAVPALSVGRKDDLIAAIVAKGGREALAAGAWVAIHNYALNHPLDYPDDDVNQRGLALTESDYKAEGTWAWDDIPMATVNAWRWQDKNPGDTILDDASCFRSFEFFNDQIVRALGFPLPIISTEGGVVMGWREDRRYPRITPRAHMQMTTAMFSYMQTDAPAYYFAMCPWLAANYALGHFSPGWESQAWFTDWWNGQFGLNGRLPTVDAVAALPSLSRLEQQGPHHSVIHGDVAAMRGVGNLRVNLRSEGFSATAASNADGRFSFSGLGPGTYTLQTGGLFKAGLQLDGTNTLAFPGLRPPLPATPVLEWDKRLSDLRVTIAPAQASAGESVWKLISAQLLDQAQAGIGGAIYYDVLDELGRPLAGQEVILSWSTGVGRKATELRESPGHGAEFPISATYDPSSGPGPYSAWIDGQPSDHVTGLGMPVGQSVGFILTFQHAPYPGPGGSAITGAISGDAGGRSIILRLPDNSTRSATTDANGQYAFEALPPGSYDIEIGGHGAAGRGLLLDGANTVVFDFALPEQGSTLRGSVIGGGRGLEVLLRSSSGETRRTTTDDQGRFEFRLLPAGVYSISVGRQTVSNLTLDGLNVVEAPPIDIHPRQSIIAGYVRYSGGTPAGNVAVQLTAPDSSASETRTASDGSYEFAGLGEGTYTVSAGQKSQSASVDGRTHVRVDLELPLEKALQLAVLLGPAGTMGTRVNLRLAQRYIRQFGPAVTFRIEEAERARQVLIIGDLQAVSAANEERLRAAGCTVARVGGTPYAIEDGLARLLATGATMPTSRSAIILPRRRPGG